jgi:putative Ca2+/H+ antiporter (TMEM165/GDT1 family)
MPGAGVPIEAFLVSFGAVFVAELGDKSQLMALTFAARYPALVVLAGVTIATFIVHAVSVVLGVAFAAAIPTDLVQIIAGVAFFGFALWTLRGDSLDEKEQGKASRAGGWTIVAVGTAFFLAELGDKTMLVTITLATTAEPWGTWLGSTLGMVAADAIAIAIGAWLGARLPEQAIKVVAAVAFLLFGVVLVAAGLGVSVPILGLLLG